MRALTILSFVISLAALGVSLFSAEQARRAATASERMLPIAEEQVRPRLLFKRPVVKLEGEFAVITVNVSNGGAAPATVNRLKIEMPTGPGGSRKDYEFAGMASAILYVGVEREARLRLPRRLRPAGAEEIDLADLDPKSFLFSIAYEVYGKPQLAFEESVKFGSLKWTRATAKAAAKKTPN